MTTTSRQDEQIDVESLNREFERASPQKILGWAVTTFGNDLVMSSSFGAESAVLLHMVSQIAPQTRVIFVDTGYLFPETYAFMEQLRHRLNLNVWIYRTRNDPVVYLSVHGEGDPTLRRDIESCCAENKNEPFARAMAEQTHQAWLRGIRRAQADSRRDRHFIEWSRRYSCWAISPLLNMSTKDAYAYLKANKLPLHPLVDRGYLSIGCNPLTCTRPVIAGEDPRAGRWSGSNKTECGVNLT
jgi:phosphoadenosine phosphosulfate reductase